MEQVKPTNGALIDVPRGMHPVFNFAEDRELQDLAKIFCDQAIRQGKQDSARKAIAKLIAGQVNE